MDDRLTFYLKKMTSYNL